MPSNFVLIRSGALWALLSIACNSGAEARGAAVASSAPAAARSTVDKPVEAPRGAYRHPQPERLVAIGDVHGDLAATRKALRLSGAVDENDRWIGGRLVVVQVGDQLDRGDGERAILDLLSSLERQAKEANGAVHELNGNHETMNVMGDFRYVTPGGFAAFADVDSSGLPVSLLSRIPDDARGRAAAFFPGGPYARVLAERRVVAVVGDTVFAHAGVRPEHVRYGIDRLNAETSRWMRGDLPSPPPPILDADGPVWTRGYSEVGKEPDCEALGKTLESLQVKRMVVAHTPQMTGINGACNGRVFRIDVGMSAHYGGHVEVLEIVGEAVRPLREKKE